MNPYQELFIFLFSFAVIVLAAWQTGKYFKRFGLPIISGYLFTGIVAGPFVLNLVSEEMAHRLLFLEEMSLAFIAFAAGSELYVPELRHRLGSIGWVTAGLVVATFSLVSTAVFLLADFIPFMQAMSANARLAVALLAGAIMTARSPSSAIAIVNELRAKGPFTQTALGVTVIMDVVVITLFAITASLADLLLTSQGVGAGFLLLLLADLLLAVVVAFLLYRVISAVLALKLGQQPKTVLIVLAGYGVFVGLDFVRDYTHDVFPFEVLVEPLLVCLIASFLVNNFSPKRMEFAKILHDTGPLIYVLFFTLVGSLLQLPVLAQTWPIALALFATRLVAITVGSFAGSTVAGEPMSRRRLYWMAFVTQAGVALGLAEETAVEFQEIGAAFATLIISVVVLNETVGPIFFKRAINLAGEARTRAASLAFDGVRDVVIFGLKPQSVQLARQLEAHEWQVKLVCLDEAERTALDEENRVSVTTIPQLSLPELQTVGLAQADALVSFLPDAQSYQICELAYENFGTETMVVWLNDRANFEAFHSLGVLVVEPQTAVVTLLEHFVRAPAGTSLLLGMHENQEMMDVELSNTALDGMTIRDLHLPLEILILSVQRDGHSLITHGYTRLKLGDKVTMVGSSQELDEIALRFEG